jgi:hypothetical protein
MAQMNESSLTRDRRPPSPDTSDFLHPGELETENRHVILK